MTHICIGKQTIIVSDDGLLPGWRQAIIWTNAGILLIGPLGTNFSEILIEILTFSFTKMCLKVSSVKWRPFCLGLNMLIYVWGYSFGITMTSPSCQCVNSVSSDNTIILQWYQSILVINSPKKPSQLIFCGNNLEINQNSITGWGL